MTPTRLDTLVVGGGFYGARLALLQRARGGRVLLVERESTLLERASLRNQARVHNGYHYPRSILTSLRSRLNYSRFLDEYAECVDRSFPHFYAVARGMSKITAGQFTEFCRRIGAPLIPAPAAVTKLFDSSRIDSVFEVQECAFDAAALRARMTRDLEAAGVEVMLDTEAERITGSGVHGATVQLRQRGESLEVEAELVLNCTYSRLNHLLVRSGAAAIPAKHELTELALVEPPPELGGAAVTVMDGPFFSLMPYPSRELFTLSHVRYTPQCSWQDGPDSPIADGDRLLRHPAPESRFVHMVRDAQRYLPAMRATKYVESLWEVKTLMPRSEQDDSRPILLRRSAEHPACLSVMGAKIDSVYDVEEALGVILGDAKDAARGERSFVAPLLRMTSLPLTTTPAS
jgi:glycine/D-amino acid oxidase-like deaminating enzyme